jgi:hypothetical protein
MSAAGGLGTARSAAMYDYRSHTPEAMPPLSHGYTLSHPPPSMDMETAVQLARAGIYQPPTPKTPAGGRRACPGLAESVKMPVRHVRRPPVTPLIGSARGGGERLSYSM